MPLFYPDLSIPSIIYIKRLRTNSFFDLAYANDILEVTNTVTEKKRAYFLSEWMLSYSGGRVILGEETANP